MNVKITDAPTIRIDIFIAGDLEQAKQACREWCMNQGACPRGTLPAGRAKLAEERG